MNRDGGEDGDGGQIGRKRAMQLGLRGKKIIYWYENRFIDSVVRCGMETGSHGRGRRILLR